jgi:hypothetical protein
MAEHEPGNGVGGSASPEGTAGERRPVVPDHDLLRCIGRGSYGEVWLARCVLGMLRAVKVVYRDRFRDARPYEREFTGILRVEPLSRASDGLVDILHVGRHEPQGYFYYVMELADDASEEAPLRNAGPASAARYQPLTLARELKRRGRLPCEQCVQLGLNLSSALSHLHQNGLIHRDVKPSNILYVGGQPKLGDIGLVGETGESVSYVGTEGYIPPEGPGTPQADVFSLGKVLYEASTGQDRLEFPMLPTALVDESAQAQLGELNEVFLKACAPDPRTRYQNAEELHADLALLHRGQSVRRQRRTERRWRRASMAGYAVAAAVGLAGGALWSPLHRAPVGSARNVNLLVNGDFADGKHGWNCCTWKGGAAKFDVSKVSTGGRAMSVEVTTPGPDEWSIQLNQPVALEAGCYYTVSFRAQGDQGQQLNALFQQTEGDHKLASYFFTAALTTNWQSFSTTFKATNTEREVQLTFDKFGLKAGITHFADVQLVCHGSSPALAGSPVGTTGAAPPNGPRQQAVDLSRFYNVALGSNWMHDFPGNHLACLPTGWRQFGPACFKAGGLIQLDGAYLRRLFFPDAVEGIPVGRRCVRLYFLHGTAWQTEHGRQVGCYVVHYADGRREEIPLRYGEELRNWWWSTKSTLEISQGSPAWLGTNAATGPTEKLCLYSVTWNNPFPDALIATLDFVSTRSPSCPFLIAVTAE